MEENSDSDGEAEWLRSVAAEKYRKDHAGKIPAQPKAQTTMAYWFGNGVKKTTVKERMPNGKERQVPGEVGVLVLPKMADSSATCGGRGERR